jgi:hypothetical protein
MAHTRESDGEEEAILAGHQSGRTATATAPDSTAAPAGQAGGGKLSVAETAAGSGRGGRVVGRPTPLSWVPDAAGQPDEPTRRLRRDAADSAQIEVCGHHLRPRKGRIAE